MSVPRRPSSKAGPKWLVGEDGRPLLDKELVVLINLTKRGTSKPANVVIRGVGPSGLPLRPQVRLVAGRMPRAGSAEVIAGKSIAERFQGGGIGETLRFGMRDWTVVGIFSAATSGFNSEIWGDVDQLMQAFRRPVYSSVLFRLRDSSEFEGFKEQIESDPRLTLEAKRETRYYYDQSEAMAKFLRILGLSLTIIFSLGAVIGAMITMYAAVANRTTEIGTMRALGFGKGSILSAFILESLLLGSVGGGARDFLRLLHAGYHHFHHELADLFRACLQLYPDVRDSLEIAPLFPYHGACRRSAAGNTGSEDEYSRGAQGFVMGNAPLNLL